MKITKTAKIGGITYNIVTSAIIDKDNSIDGQIDFKRQLIELKEDMPINSDYAKEVFIHELLHGIYNHCTLPQNEETIRAISIALYMLIKDNPDIFEKEG